MAMMANNATITRVITRANPPREVGAIDLNRLGGSGEPHLPEGRAKKRIREIRVIGGSIMKQLPTRRFFIANLSGCGTRTYAARLAADSLRLSGPSNQPALKTRSSLCVRPEGS